MIPDKNFTSKEKKFDYPRSKKHKSKTKKNAMKKAEDAVKQLRSSTDENISGCGIKSDILGSYTGMFYDGGEPDQDADDL